MTKQTKLEREGFDKVQLPLELRAGDEFRVIQEGDTLVLYSRSTTPKTKPSIDWSHLKPEYKWLAKNYNGRTVVSVEKMYINHDLWMSDSGVVHINHLASYQAGDCDWQDSLVQRPEGE